MAKKEDVKINLSSNLSAEEIRADMERTQQIVSEIERKKIEGIRSAMGSGTRSYILREDQLILKHNGLTSRR